MRVDDGHAVGTPQPRASLKSGTVLQSVQPEQRGQGAPNAYRQNSRMSGVGVGPAICA
jgi:hypothetical protein